LDNGHIGQYTANSYYNTTAPDSYKQDNITGTVNVSTTDEAVLQKSNGSSSSIDITVNMNIDKTLKNFITDALKAAGLPENERMMQLVKALLDRHQPVDKNTLLAYNRLLGQNPGVNPETLIAMQKNEIPVTKEFIEQFESCKNNENQLFRHIDEAADNIGTLAKTIFQESGTDKVMDLFDGLSKFVNEMARQTDRSVTEASSVADSKELYGNVKQPEAETVHTVKALQTELKPVLESREQTAAADKAFVDSLVEEFKEYIPEGGKEEISSGDLFGRLSKLIGMLPEEKAAELVKKLDTKEFAGLSKTIFRKVLYLPPEDVADKEKLTEYYKKLSESVEEFVSLSKELGNTAANSPVFKTFDNISDNISFMNQINEYMPYIQMPLKLLKEEGHGEFYVMKRHKTPKQSDTVTAFIRLELKYLGELDIMVKLKELRLDIDFKAEKAESAALLGSTVMSLEQRLKEKGYTVFTSIGEKEKEFDFEKDFLEAESSDGVIGRYSFDMKI